MTWPHLVWKALHERWPSLDIDYMNDGVPGYSTRALLPALDKRVSQLNPRFEKLPAWQRAATVASTVLAICVVLLARFRPDIIVIYEAPNDLRANTYELARDQGVVASRPQVDDFDWFTRHSLLALLVRKNLEIMRLQSLATNGSGKVSLDTARLDAEFRKDYTNLVAASAKVAKVVVPVTFAPRLRAEQSPEERKEAAVTDLYYTPYMTIDGLITTYTHYNQVIREVAEAQHTLLVGHEKSIPADDKHYTDSVHYTDAGSVSMAQRIIEVLISSAEVQAVVENKTAQNEHTIFHQLSDTKPSANRSGGKSS